MNELDLEAEKVIPPTRRKFARRNITLSMASASVMLAGTVLFAAAPSASASAATTTVTYYVDHSGTFTDSLELYYNSNESGASAYFHGNINNYAGYSEYCEEATVCEYVYVFSEGNGSGQAVKNNAASGHNDSGVYEFTVFYNSGYSGPSQTFGVEYSGASAQNLNSTLKNENASQTMH